MNFKKLQEMQLALDNAILQAKPKMSAEERFNKTLVALSAEVAEVSNCSEHFKFWKDNKGKVDDKRFKRVEYTGGKVVYEDWGKNAKKGSVSFEQAHKLTLVGEASDCLHFILSLANQCNYELTRYQKVGCDDSLEEAFLITQECILDNDVEELFVDVQDIINWFIRYINLLGITTQELEQAYYEKNEENYRRLREGY